MQRILTHLGSCPIPYMFPWILKSTASEQRDVKVRAMDILYDMGMTKPIHTLVTTKIHSIVYGAVYINFCILFLGGGKNGPTIEEPH
jgi:hypothetical protein